MVMSETNHSGIYHDLHMDLHMDITSQWFDGDLLVAPVLREDSVKEVYIPRGTWFPFEGLDDGVQKKRPPIVGPYILGGQAEYEEIPVFAPAGSIVPLAPVVQ